MNIETKFKDTLKKIKLTKEDKILVALSGGKDSTVTAYLLKKLGYKIEGFHIDLKIGEYSDKCLGAVKTLCNELDIKLHTYDIKKEMGSGMCYLRTAIQSNQDKGKLKNCAICGVIKKWILNKLARKLKTDKIATGHNLDDEVQTFLMNILKGSPSLSSNSGPITKNVSNKKFVSRIKPLFYIPENEVRKYSKRKKLPVVYEKCPCGLDSYRIQVRKFLETLSDKKKQDILGNFEKIFEKIQKTKNTKINYCELCGEPARNKICKKCDLMNLK
jgi:tRNA-5-methyluridine54 2-sulfurtransferase